MIKTFEQFTYSNEDLINKLFKEISNEKKIINGYSCSYEMSGAIEWQNASDNNYIIYATPYWNDDDNLPISIHENDSQDIVFTSNIKLKKLESLDNVAKVKKFYYNTMETIINNMPEMIAAQKYNI